MRKILLPSVIAATLALPTGARAVSYAYSSFTISNASLSFAPTPARIGTTAVFSSDSATNDTIVTGFSANGPAGADAAPAAQGFATPANNDMSQLLLNLNGARGDSAITGTTTTANSFTLGEARIKGAGHGSGSAKTSDSIAFTLNAISSLSFVFDPTQKYDVQATAIGDTAIASYTFGIDLVFHPKGKIDQAISPTTMPTANLQHSISAADGEAFSGMTDFGLLTYTFPNLAKGSYTFSLSEFSGADVVSAGRSPVQTPEPTAVVLLGLGLAGIGIARRRRI